MKYLEPMEVKMEQNRWTVKVQTGVYEGLYFHCAILWPVMGPSNGMGHLALIIGLCRWISNPSEFDFHGPFRLMVPKHPWTLKNELTVVNLRKIFFPLNSPKKLQLKKKNDFWNFLDFWCWCWWNTGVRLVRAQVKTFFELKILQILH